MFPPPGPPERARLQDSALRFGSRLRGSLSAHLVVDGGSGPGRSTHSAHAPPHSSGTRSLERPYLKDVAAPLRSCVVTSPASQRAEPCVSKAPPPPRVLHVGQCLLRSSRPVGEVVKLEGMIIARTGVKHTTGKTQTRLLP